MKKPKILSKLTTYQLKQIVKGTEAGKKAGDNRIELIKACRSIGVFEYKD